MADYQRISLSGTTNYAPINITGASTGTIITIHTAHATNADELWLFAYNYTSTDSILNLTLGGTSAYQILSTPIPAGIGEVPVLVGKTFSGSTVISGYSSVANSISVIGYCNRIVFV